MRACMKSMREATTWKTAGVHIRTSGGGACQVSQPGVGECPARVRARCGNDARGCQSSGSRGHDARPFRACRGEHTELILDPQSRMAASFAAGGNSAGSAMAARICVGVKPAWAQTRADPRPGANPACCLREALLSGSPFSARPYGSPCLQIPTRNASSARAGSGSSKSTPRFAFIRLRISSRYARSCASLTAREM